MKKLVVLLLFLSSFSSVHAFRFLIASCCTVACTAEGVATATATGGVALPAEAGLMAICLAECLTTGFVNVVLAGMAPVPVCLWALPIPV